jgi:hypothetical protein
MSPSSKLSKLRVIWGILKLAIDARSKGNLINCPLNMPKDHDIMMLSIHQGVSDNWLFLFLLLSVIDDHCLRSLTL